MKTRFAQEKPIGLTDWAYERIKASILSLEAPPGSQLEVEHLAIHLGISRTPVREALLRLERDGLVQVLPRVGFFVIDFSAKDLEELYELRELLESRAVRDAVPYLRQAELEDLDRIIRETRRAVESEDYEAFLEDEIEFHSLLTRQAPNQRLISMLESFADLTYRWRTLSIRSPEYVRISYTEHCAINEAVQARDAELASRRMGDHIRNAKARISQIVSDLHGALNADTHYKQ